MAHEALYQRKREQAYQGSSTGQKYEKVTRQGEKIHLLSGILKCPVCGAGMYGNKAIKKRKDGSNYKDFYYYGCKHRNMTRGHKCDYRKQVHEELLDAAVAEVISKLVSNTKFSNLIRSKINMEVDTGALDQEIANYEKQLRQLYHNKDSILSDIDSLITRISIINEEKQIWRTVCTKPMINRGSRGTACICKSQETFSAGR